MDKCRFILLLAVVAITASCVRPKALVYRDIQSMQVRLLKDPPITVYARFYNPNSYPLRFKDGLVNLSVDNTAIGIMTVDTAFTAPPLDTFAVPLNFNIDLRKVLPTASNLIFRDSVFVRVQGYIKAGERNKGAMLRVPLYYEGFQRLEMPQQMLLGE